LTMSSEGIDFVRKELKPSLIISENLSSPVMKENYGLEETITKTAKAGVDILLVAGFDEIEDTERAINYLKQQANQQNLEESLSRIIKLKENLPTHEKNN